MLAQCTNGGGGGGGRGGHMGDVEVFLDSCTNLSLRAI